MGYDLSGFDLSALNNIPGYQQQEEYLQFLARASADTRQSVDAAKKAAAIKALRRRSVDLEAAYRKLYPDAYRPGGSEERQGGSVELPGVLQRPGAGQVRLPGC